MALTWPRPLAQVVQCEVLIPLKYVPFYYTFVLTDRSSRRSFIKGNRSTMNSTRTCTDKTRRIKSPFILVLLLSMGSLTACLRTGHIQSLSLDPNYPAHVKKLERVIDQRPQEEKAGKRPVENLSIDRLSDQQLKPSISFYLDYQLQQNTRLGLRNKVTLLHADILHGYNLDTTNNFSAVNAKLDYHIPLLHQNSPQQLPQFVSCRIKGQVSERYFEVVQASGFEPDGMLDATNQMERTLRRVIRLCVNQSVAKIKKLCQC